MITYPKELIGNIKTVIQHDLHLLYINGLLQNVFFI
jgi:hypothetical protein